jgi:CRISPR-associated endonuclease Cas2
MAYLIAYDIADPRRLRRVARFFERRALRCQKSVFLFQGDETTLIALLDEAARRIEGAADVIQAWRLTPGQPPLGHVRGSALPLYPTGVVLAPGQQHILGGPVDPSAGRPTPQ